MKRKTVAYLDGYGAVQSVLELDILTAQEMVDALDPEREDPLLNPWKRGYNAVIRRALGH